MHGHHVPKTFRLGEAAKNNWFEVRAALRPRHLACRYPRRRGAGARPILQTRIVARSLGWTVRSHHRCSLLWRCCEVSASAAARSKGRSHCIETLTMRCGPRCSAFDRLGCQQAAAVFMRRQDVRYTAASALEQRRFTPNLSPISHGFNKEFGQSREACGVTPKSGEFAQF